MNRSTGWIAGESVDRSQCTFRSPTTNNGLTNVLRRSRTSAKSAQNAALTVEDLVHKRRRRCKIDRLRLLMTLVRSRTRTSEFLTCVSHTAHVTDIGWTICPSVRWYCIETAQSIVKLSSLHGSPMILVFRGISKYRYRYLSRYSKYRKIPNTEEKIPKER